MVILVPNEQNLTPDVRDRAAHELYRSENYGFDQWGRFPSDRRDVFRARVDAVTAVVAPEIARPLQARIEVLKTENLHLSLELEARDDAQWDLHQRLLPELAEAKEENRRLHDVVHRERPSVGDMVIELPQLRADRDALKAKLGQAESLAAKFDAENLHLRDQAGEMAEEIEELSSEVAALPEWHCPSCNAVTRAKMADAMPDALQARIEEAAALTEMLSQNLPGRVWDDNARAALAAGEAAARKNAFCQTCGDTVCPDCHPGATLYAANEKLHAALTELVPVAGTLLVDQYGSAILTEAGPYARAVAALAAGEEKSDA